MRLTHLWRAFNGYDSAGTFAESDIQIYSMTEFNERPFRLAERIQFLQAGLPAAGPLTTAGLVAPEFQIANEITLIMTENRMAWLSYQFVDSRGNKHAGTDYDATNTLSDGSVLLHTAAWEADAAAPATLVDKLNLVLMAGQMSPAMKATLVNYVSQIPADSPWTRVAEAAALVICLAAICNTTLNRR